MILSTVLSNILGLAGLGVSIYAIRDNNRQRTQREKAVIAAHSVVAQVYGILIGIKPAVDTSVQRAINDGLEVINQGRDALKNL